MTGAKNWAKNLAKKRRFWTAYCNTTLAEFTFNDNGDSYDISLVNGINYGMNIIDSLNQKALISVKTSDLATIKKTYGVYPIGCSRCVDGVGIAPNFQGNGTTTQNCPGYGRPPGPMPKGSCKTGEENNPQPNPCQYTNQSAKKAYTVEFLDLQ